MSLSPHELSKAIDSLEEALRLEVSAKQSSLEKKAFRDACIQRFEYCIELAWKTSIKLLGSTVASAIPAIREMARNNLINDPTSWLEFIEARNNSSHSYDEDVANKVFIQIQKFLPQVKLLMIELKKMAK